MEIIRQELRPLEAVANLLVTASNKEMYPDSKKLIETFPEIPVGTIRNILRNQGTSVNLSRLHG